MLLVSILYRLVHGPLGLTVVLARRDLSKDVELLVLGHENTVLRRQIPRAHYTPVDRVRLAALSRLPPRAAGPTSFRLLPPRSWPGTAGWSHDHGTTPYAASPDVHRPQRRSKSW